MNSDEVSSSGTSSLETLKKASRWLSAYARDVYSQTGEDGIVAQALAMLPARNRWCVEFGAWDGKHLSNTFRLVEEDDYEVVLIEGDAEKYRRLRADYPYQDRGTFVHGLVGWTEQDGLDAILSGTAAPQDFDLLSIDIDGNDYHVWAAVKKYRPKLVLIEFNPTASNRIDFSAAGCEVQPERQPGGGGEARKGKGLRTDQRDWPEPAAGGFAVLRTVSHPG